MQYDCNHCRELLWSFVAKELSDSETKKIKEHLQGCPSCRQEAEQLSLVISSLQEEIPLPATFFADLHKKLSLAAEEMATEKPTFLERLKNLPKQRSFRTVAPALVCLVLVVGVFSSGLFEKWNSADRILKDPSVKGTVSTSAPTEIASPAPPEETVVPITDPQPQLQAPATPQTAEADTPAQPIPAAEPQVPVTEAPTTPSVASEPVIVEDVPAPASIEQEDLPTGFAIPRQRSELSCLTMADTETFLNQWQEATSYEWEPHIQDIDARELVPGIDSAALVLELAPDAFDSLMDFAVGIEPLQENQGETLVIIIGDEE